MTQMVWNIDKIAQLASRVHDQLGWPVPEDNDEVWPVVFVECANMLGRIGDQLAAGINDGVRISLPEQPKTIPGYIRRGGGEGG